MSGDLDEFFAKKDKTRKKKTKGITNDEFVKRYEAKCKEDAANRERTSKQMLMNLDGFLQDQADEWNDFEDENKDYSGLKIQPLVVEDKDQIETEEEIAAKKESFGWGSRGPDPEQSSETTGGTASSSKEVATAGTAGGEEPGKSTSLELGDLADKPFEYLFRNRKVLAGTLLGGGGPKGPDIGDIGEFPDLGATPEAIEDAKSYQVVRGGSGSSHYRAAPPPPLPGQRGPSYHDVTTDNKFSALRRQDL